MCMKAHRNIVEKETTQRKMRRKEKRVRKMQQITNGTDGRFGCWALRVECLYDFITRSYIVVFVLIIFFLLFSSISCMIKSYKHQRSINKRSLGGVHERSINTLTTTLIVHRSKWKSKIERLWSAMDWMDDNERPKESRLFLRAQFFLFSVWSETNDHIP